MASHIKKSLLAAERDREDVKEARRDWVIWRMNAPVPKLVFLDESGIRTNISPIYGWSKKGERCFGFTPGAWKSYTILSAINTSRVIDSILIDGAVDKSTFKYFMEDLLFPKLEPGTIVVMDNLSVHKNSFNIYKFRRRSIDIKYMPPYSPDFNPIENMWSKVKSIIRKISPKNFDEVWNATNEALWQITRSNLAGWFTGCGYIH